MQVAGKQVNVPLNRMVVPIIPIPLRIQVPIEYTVARSSSEETMRNVRPPVIEPAGGEFSSPVILELNCLPGETVYYTTDGSNPTDQSTAYSGPFALLQGSKTLVGAVAVDIRDGARSNVTWARFEVRPCIMIEERCCNWQDMLARFEALRRSLVLRNQTLSEDAALQTKQVSKTEEAWLDSESAYGVAVNHKRTAEEGEKYAMQFVQVWAQASKVADQRYAAIHKQDEAEKAQLEEQRAWIREVLKMLDKLAEKEPSAGKAQQMRLIQSRMRQLPKSILQSTVMQMLTSSIADAGPTADEIALLKKMIENMFGQDALIDKVCVWLFLHDLACLCLWMSHS